MCLVLVSRIAFLANYLLMLKILKKIWNDPVWSKVISVAIIALVTQYFFQWWQFLVQLVKGAVTFFLQTTQVPNWLISLMLVCSIVVLAVIIIAIYQSRQPATGLSWQLNYKEDVFFNVLWRWNYANSGRPENIHTFCPKCDFQIYHKNVSGYRSIDHIAFQCEVCNAQLADFDESYEHLENKVIRLLQLKIRNGSWNEELAK